VHELILYATPTGALATACERYFAVSEALGTTTAHAYPPHITMTGFFHRSGDRLATVIDEVARAADGTTPAVVVVRLDAQPSWVGLVIESQDLIAVSRRFESLHQRTADEDPIRVKTWLHLSLAYGADDLGAHARLADDLVDPRADAGWEVALWERHVDGSWTTHR
jgi:ubiquitin-associated SH3 domain-containing protein